MEDGSGDFLRQAQKKEVTEMRKIWIGTVMVMLMLALLCGQAQSEDQTIGRIKTLPDDTVLSTPITGVVSTYVEYQTFGSFSYIQEINRSTGIAVDSVGVAGQIVQVTGTIKSMPSGERYIADSAIVPTGQGQLVPPVGMNNKTAGSIAGLNPDGLTVSVWGKVTSSGYDDDAHSYLYIDDGSGLLDGTSDWEGNPNKGLRVLSHNAFDLPVGDYFRFTGPLGIDTNYDNTCSYKVLRQPLSSAKLVAPEAYALGGNHQIYVTWDGDPCAGAYRVYRSETETGYYSVIGQTTAKDLSFLDKPLPNGRTRWYKITSLSGPSEGPASVAVSATTTASAPVVSIDTITIDSEGILDITYSCAPGIGGTDIPMVSFDIDGVELWDDSPSELGPTWCYDTTELKNGIHTVGVKVLSANAETGTRYLGYAKSSFTANNNISSLFVSEIADATTPFQATFNTECNWTITVRQGTTVLAQDSGTGKELDWLWDTTGYEGSAEVEITYTPTSNPEVQRNLTETSTTGTQSKLSTFWITHQGLLAKSGHYQWAAWYARDRVINSFGPWLWADLFFRNKFGQPLSGYDTQLTMSSHWDTLVLESFRHTEEPAKISHVVWSGHGNYGVDIYTHTPNVLQANAWLADFVGQSDGYWFGVSPFKDYNDTATRMKVTALGPKIGNKAAWKKAGNGRGRVEITQMTRRLKFAVVFGCWSTRGTMALALGIPKKQIPGCKCVFVGFHNKLWFPSPADNFSQYLFDQLAKGKKVGVAVNYASRAFAQVTGDASRSNPQVFGDPNMTVGRYAP